MAPNENKSDVIPDKEFKIVFKGTIKQLNEIRKAMDRSQEFKEKH